MNILSSPASRSHQFILSWVWLQYLVYRLYLVLETCVWKQRFLPTFSLLQCRGQSRSFLFEVALSKVLAQRGSIALEFYKTNVQRSVLRFISIHVGRIWYKNLSRLCTLKRTQTTLCREFFISTWRLFKTSVSPFRISNILIFTSNELFPCLPIPFSKSPISTQEHTRWWMNHL